mmetsp:Transcript_63851/g.122767  ORF Transcript_63851/g.122767 Transcript_63851/m.122767 type:complete len:398 (-) Transcript_63851:175-1368(-)
MATGSDRRRIRGMHLFGARRPKVADDSPAESSPGPRVISESFTHPRVVDNDSPKKSSRGHAVRTSTGLVCGGVANYMHYRMNNSNTNSTASPAHTVPTGRGKPGSVNRARSRAASTGRSIMQLTSAKKTVPRRRLQVLPNGTIEVPNVSLDGCWAECLRDLSRMLHGKAVYMIGPEQMHPVQVNMKTAGDVSDATCKATFASLISALRNGLTAQGAAQSTCRVAPSTSLHGRPWPEESQSVGDWKLESRVLQELARQVAIHISTGPGMQVVLQEKLPPALWQPTFIICISPSQVRVLTFAFVGAPATGDRPERKRTPFLMRMLTDDISASAPQPRPDESVTWMPTGTTAVKYMVEFVRAPIVSERIIGMREELCQQVWNDSWGSIMPFLDGTRASTT